MSSVLNIYNLDKYDPNSFLIPLTFSINDFRNLDTRNGVFSKTIKVPGTKKNDSLLGSAFDITAEGFFDRNKRSRAIVERDGIRYLDGSVQLKKVNISQGRFHEYELILYGELSDWANLLKGRNIRDIEYSTVLYNYANLSGTWNNNGRDNEYVFPMVDYGTFSKPTIPDSSTDITVERFRPSVFVYYIFRKIFEAIDYELKPGFFARKEFRNLILPYVGEATYASQEEIDGNRLEGNKDLAQVFATSLETTVINYLNAGGIDDNVDPGNNFNSTTGVYTAPYDGNYTIISRFTTQNKSLLSETITYRLKKNGVTTLFEIDKEYDYLEFYSFYVNMGSYDLVAGDTLELTLEGNSISPNYELFSADFDITLSQIPIQDGVKFDIVNGVYDITQVDFIKSFCQMFNLVCLTDSRLKSVEFIHRDEFYKPISEADDWSSKLDINRPQELEQIEEGLNSILKFEYAKDENDDSLVSFRQTYNTYYGNDERILDNEFLQGSKNVANLPYAPTLMGYGFVNNTHYLPRMYNDGFTKELEPRVLIYDGLQNGSWTFDSNNETQYPFAYFIKNISTPQDISLSFSNLKDVSQGLQQNDLGLVDKYYKEQIRQINNGRLYTCYLKLNPIDIVNLDFRKPKLINGVYYYLNKVEDYLAGKDVSTKVELIQVV